MNAIRQLLDQVIVTGQLPDADDITAAVTRGATVAERQTARQEIRRTARRIIGAVELNVPDQAAQLAADTAEALARFTNDDTAKGPRELAAGVPRSQQFDPGTPKKRSVDAQPLHELLAGATRGGIRAVELDKLRTRSGASADEVSQWRKDVLNASREVARVYGAGNQGLARRMAAEFAEEHAGMLAGPATTDPHADVDDPRELAALVSRGRGHN